VTPAELQFDGLAPWPAGRGVIEVEIDGVHCDLHNVARFTGWRWVPPDRLRLTWAVGEDLRRVELEFAGVRGLQVEQPADWVPEEADGFEHVMWSTQTSPAPAPFVDLVAGGLRFGFLAERVRGRVVTSS
jgi:hypothetical protein